MAERRMFAKTIIDSDAFLDMPLSTQALYFHLSMRADDEGFINNPKKIQRMIGATEDDLKLLVAKNFIIPFESGVVVIKHWKIHNYIRKDRIAETVYAEERAMLEVKNNGAYTLPADGCLTHDGHMSASCLPDGSIGKDRLDKDSIDKDSIESKAKSTRFVPPTIEEVREYCKERGNNVDAQRFIDFYESKGWMIGKNRMKDWKAAVRTWEKRERENNPAEKPLDERTRKRYAKYAEWERRGEEVDENTLKRREKYAELEKYYLGGEEES